MVVSDGRTDPIHSDVAKAMDGRKSSTPKHLPLVLVLRLSVELSEVLGAASYYSIHDPCAALCIHVL